VSRRQAATTRRGDPAGLTPDGDGEAEVVERAWSADGPAPRRPASRPRALVQLGVVLAAMVTAFLVAGLGALLLFVVALVLIVVVHELGHYVTAKLARMKVTEYFIGFGPRLWSVRVGETEYGVKPILVGAYVKIPGMTNLEEVPADDEERTYRQKPFRWRILVASAGSIMHYVMAFVLAVIAVLAFGAPSSATQVRVTGFVSWSGHAETAAQKAGLRAGDRILEVDGRRVSTNGQLAAAIQASRGHAVTLLVTAAGRHESKTVVPVAGHKVRTARTGTTREVLGAAPGKRTDWLIGVEIGTAPVFVSKSPFAAIGWAATDVAAVTKATVLGIGKVFSPGGLSSLYDQVTNPQAARKASAHPTSSSRVVSVVGFARVATQAEQEGGYYFVSILVALNIVLGLMNMLPMLPLDGGHVAVALYERVRTRRGRRSYQADVTKLLPVAYAFMALLVLIVGSAVFLDIAHPLANPFG
jgi:membrane-associated protease RseP (regulator of RpoE activity)